MTLLYIVLATAIGGVTSVVVAAFLTVRLLDRLGRSLVSLSAGVLLATALLHVLPEAFAHGHAHIHRIGDPAHHHATPATLFATLLGGVLFFWLLEKADLYRRWRRASSSGAAVLAETRLAGRGAVTVLAGDGLHNFCDGVIIAAAFLTSPSLGVVTALAIAAHEIPQEAGDYIVLLEAGYTRARALLWNAVTGLAAVAGGVVGYRLMGSLDGALPYLLVVASSSFLYVAMSDLLPSLQQPLPAREAAVQVVGLALGLAIVLFARFWLDPSMR
jgi:zinc and cadmium transporter